MRKLFILTAASALVAFGGTALAQGAGDPGVNGSLSVTPPGASGHYAPYDAAPRGWRSNPYWRSAHRGDSLPRYAQSVPDNYWPGPQNWQYTPGPL
jgi:hypothetical protein